MKESHFRFSVRLHDWGVWTAFPKSSCVNLPNLVSIPLCFLPCYNFEWGNCYRWCYKLYTRSGFLYNLYQTSLKLQYNLSRSAATNYHNIVLSGRMRDASYTARVQCLCKCHCSCQVRNSNKSLHDLQQPVTPNKPVNICWYAL